MVMNQQKPLVSLGDHTHIGVLPLELKKKKGSNFYQKKPEEIYSRRSQSSVEAAEHKGLAVGTMRISRRHQSMKERSLPKPDRFTWN